MPDDVVTADWTSCEDAEQKSTMYSHNHCFENNFHTMNASIDIYISQMMLPLSSCENAEQKSTMYIHEHAFPLILIHSPLSVSVAHVTPQRT